MGLKRLLPIGTILLASACTESGLQVKETVESEEEGATAKMEADVPNVKWIDITKVYRTTDGQPFAYVVLDARAGVKVDDGPYRIAPDDKALDSIAPVDFAVIKRKCEEAEALLNRGSKEDAREAFSMFSEALDLLPEPYEKWHASGWILSRMGECYFRTGSYEQAEQLYGDLMWCPGALGNPWIHLRKGQVHYECGQTDRAADDLMRAYMGGGKEVFRLEADKYYEFLKTKADGLEP